MTHSILSEEMYTQREQTKRSTRQSRPPVAPHRRFTYTQSIQTNNKHASAVTKSAFFERGNPKSEGGSS